MKIIICLLFITMCVTCTSRKQELDGQLNSELARQAGVDNRAISSLKAGIEMNSLLTKAVTFAISDIPYEDERRYGENIGLAMYATPGFGEPIMNKELGLYINMLTNIIGRDSDRPGVELRTNTHLCLLGFLGIRVRVVGWAVWWLAWRAGGVCLV